MYKNSMEKLKETRVFRNGSSQAVRIPKDYRFDTEVVYLKRVSGGLLLLSKDERFNAMREALGEFTDDFMAGREQGKPEIRKGFA
jgi:antitoxin VapB